MTMRRIILVGASLMLSMLVAYGIYLLYLLFTGYCFAQDKYLSDNEYIVAALQHVEQDRKAADSKPEEYLRSHPECCAVDRNYSSWFNNLTDFFRVEVELNFELKPSRRGSLNYPYYTSYISITACGTYGGREIGESTQTPKRAAFRR